MRGYKTRYINIEKPPTCKLDEGTYRLLSEPEGEIKPQVCVSQQICNLRGSKSKNLTRLKFGLVHLRVASSTAAIF